jgi:hypothetical protein
VIESFRHKGLEELYLTGKTRRIGADVSRKCARILQLLELADKPEDLSIAGVSFPRPAWRPETLVFAHDRELPHHVRLGRRQSTGDRL